MIGLLVDGRYQVTARLARGGMATVYVARDERLDRLVALKVMHPHLAESEDFVARFRREARAAARIHHPGVVAVYDQGVVSGQGFLVMELVEGTNLRALLSAQGAFTIEQTLRYVSDILQALHAAHRVGVVHRDIKPENILVPPEGPVRVADFGLARAASEASQSSTGNMLGTVAYIAPEIARGGGADARSDIYSVGIMAYEMLTGDVPWAGQSPIQIATHHVSDDVPLPSASQPWIPREVDDLVAALTARDPANRPADAVHALDLARRAAESLPADLASRRADVAGREQTGSALTAMKTAVVSAPALTAVLPASSQTTVRVADAPAKPEPPAVVRHGRRTAAVIGAIAVLLVVGLIGGGWWWTEYGPGSYIAMPTTDGRDLGSVRADLEGAGLGVVVEEEFSDTVAAGLVVRSDPASGTRVHKRGDVHVFVSKGVDMRVVPALTGKTKDEATEALTAAGLQPGTITYDYSEDVEEGRVITQGSEPGASLVHDTTVDLSVSKGKEPIPVPDLVGQKGDAAKQRLEELGLVAKPTEAYSDTVAAVDVISQQPAPSTVLHRKDAVDYVVSKGPEKVPVPDVQGKQRDEARRILEEAGFKVEENNILGGFFGTVRSTDPAAGTVLKRESTVTLNIV